MAQPTDESKASTLPDPELNPLLNPLLAANMGRWAEVYFTSAPERRAQAVADLLQELASQPRPPAPIEDPVQNSVPPRQFPPQQDVLLHRSFESVEEEPSTVCESCGEKNPQSQRFCGMCGTPLVTFTGNSWASPPEPEPPAEAEWDEPESAVHGMMGQAHAHSEDDLEEGISEEARDRDKEREEASNDRPVWRTDHVGWSSPEPCEAETKVGSDGLFSFEAAPARRNYRLYIAAGVAILLAVLVFMRWRGNALIGDSGAATSELPASTPPAVKSTPAAVPQPAAAAPLPVTEDDSKPAKKPDPVPPAPRKQTRLAERNTTNSAVTASATAPAPTATPASVQGNGNDDLATAEKYLYGGPGRARDSAQGASWLWRAVAKQNLTATLLLSDLYLRGDGVTKNCDQARLLLDAAARKGAAPAAEKLRHLPEFGCQ